MSRRHIFVYDDDWEWIEAHVGPNSESKMGVAAFIRETIAMQVKKLQARRDRIIDQEAVERKD